MPPHLLMQDAGINSSVYDSAWRPLSNGSKRSRGSFSTHRDLSEALAVSRY